MNLREKDILQQSIKIIKDVLNPTRIILFGSRAKKTNDPHADFDFAIDCEKPSISIQREINDRIEKISGLYKVDIVYIPSVDEEFKNIILKTGTTTYEKRT